MLGTLLTCCVVVFSSGEQLVSVLGVFDVQLDQVLLLQVQQIFYRLVAVQQQGGCVLLKPPNRIFLIYGRNLADISPKLDERILSPPGLSAPAAPAALWVEVFCTASEV